MVSNCIFKNFNTLYYLFFFGMFFIIKILSSIFFQKKVVMQQYKVPSWCSRELQMVNVLQIFLSDSTERNAWYFPSSLHCCLLWLLLYFLLLMSFGSIATLCDSFILLPGDWQFWEFCFCFWSFTIHQYDRFAWNKCM